MIQTILIVFPAINFAYADVRVEPTSANHVPAAITGCVALAADRWLFTLDNINARWPARTNAPRFACL